jgi:hypothetical protein
VTLVDSKGQASKPNDDTDHRVALQEKRTEGNVQKICSPECVSATPNKLSDTMSISAKNKGYEVEKRFTVDGKSARIYDPTTQKAYDYVRVDASMRKGFVFNYGNDPN